MHGQQNLKGPTWCTFFFFNKHIKKICAPSWFSLEDRWIDLDKDCISTRLDQNKMKVFGKKSKYRPWNVKECEHSDHQTNSLSGIRD